MEETFKCSYCGKEYHNPLQRANCEIACYKELEEKKHKETDEKLQKEKEIRKAEINALIKQRHEIDKTIYEKIKAFEKDYKSAYIQKDFTVDELALDFINVLNSIWG